MGSVAPIIDLDALPALVEEFLTWLAVERGRAANTLAAYRRDLRAYVGWLDGRELRHVTGSDLDAYVVHLRGRGYRPSSVARAMVAVRGLHQFIAAEGFVDGDPSSAIEVPRARPGLPKALREDEIGLLFAALQGDDAIGRRDRVIVELLYGTGMRIGELTGLDLADVDLSGALVRVFGKGSKERVVPLGREARSALTRWLSPEGREALAPQRWTRRVDAESLLLNHRGGRLGRQGAWSVVHELARTTGLDERLTPHVLRHSCATHLLEHGADIRVVQELLGHASLSTTQIYTKVTVEHLRSVYLSAHPRARRE